MSIELQHLSGQQGVHVDRVVVAQVAVGAPSAMGLHDGVRHTRVDECSGATTTERVPRIGGRGVGVVDVAGEERRGQ